MQNHDSAHTNTRRPQGRMMVLMMMHAKYTHPVRILLGVYLSRECLQRFPTYLPRFWLVIYGQVHRFARSKSDENLNKSPGVKSVTNKSGSAVLGETRYFF
jgi:hypothetical protein